jgi:hypothetical protein
MKTFVNLRASSLVEPLALTGAIVSTPINVSTINMQLTSCGRGIVIMHRPRLAEQRTLVDDAMTIAVIIRGKPLEYSNICKTR